MSFETLDQIQYVFLLDTSNCTAIAMDAKIQVTV